MRAGLAAVRDDRGLDSVESAVRTLEDEWNHGEPSLERHWREFDSNGSVSLLAALVKADLRCRFARGRRPSVADYLERFPALRRRDERVLSLIYEEFCLLEEQGERPDAEEFRARYPSWSDSLASQLGYHQMLSQVVAPAAPAPRFPEPGDHFEEYQLERILGTGGAAQVYLAHDESLGGRPVALKISLDRGQEPSIQGRLDHAHIVPVHSVAFQTETELRGLCMPYRPGLPLDKVIERVNLASAPWTARALLEAIAEGEPSKVPNHARKPGWDGYPIQGTYADGVAWIIATLARALAYAHGQGILHRDVKPANILMTHRDGPQLLDFNLAYDPHSASQAMAAMRGGTLPYMAPEQLEAFLDPLRWDEVGVRADLYSLGLVMCEMLTGRPPETPGPNLPPPRAIRELLDGRYDLRVALREDNPSIPHALEAIAGRLLTADPTERYPNASSLADDLQRFLDRRPLAHAVNPSRRERAVNWAWRNRRVLPVACLLATLALFCTYQGLRWLVPIEKDPEFLAAVKAIDEHQPEEALSRLDRLVRKKPGSPLVQAYLGIALDQSGNHEEAWKHVARSIRDPSDLDILSTWGRTHPGLAEDFAAIGRHLFQEPERSQNLARNVFRVAELINPRSIAAREGVATLEALFNEHQVALTRWNALIQQAHQHEIDVSELRLVGWFLNRAESLIGSTRKQLERDPSQIATARAGLQQAVRDCKDARLDLATIDPDRHFKCNHIQAEALIDLGLVEDRDGHGDDADAAYREADANLKDLERTSVDLRREQRQRLELLRKRLGAHWPRPGEKGGIRHDDAPATASPGTEAGHHLDSL